MFHLSPEKEIEKDKIMILPQQSWPRAFLPLAAFIAVFQIIGSLIGILTTEGTTGWYQTLNRSPLTPPDWVFGAMWSFLYVLLAVAAWMIWQRRNQRLAKAALGLFTFHMILNWAWNPVFFIGHAFLPALILILVLIGTLIPIFLLFFKIRRTASYLLIPYGLWLCFAVHLSFYIWQNNGL